MLDDSRCQDTVYLNDPWGSFHGHQCKRKPWKDGLCKQHHPDTVKARYDASRQRYEDARKSAPGSPAGGPMLFAALEALLSCPKHDYDHPLTYVLLCLDEEQITFGKACEAIQELAQGKTPVLPEGICRTAEGPVLP